MSNYGKMRHSVELQRASVAFDAMNQSIPTWSTVARCMAAVEPVSGRSFFSAVGDRAEITHEITIRAQPPNSPREKYRVLFGSREFEITSIADVDERGRWWVMRAIERLNADGN